MAYTFYKDEEYNSFKQDVFAYLDRWQTLVYGVKFDKKKYALSIMPDVISKDTIVQQVLEYWFLIKKEGLSMNDSNVYGYLHAAENIRRRLTGEEYHKYRSVLEDDDHLKKFRKKIIDQLVALESLDPCDRFLSKESEIAVRSIANLAIIEYSLLAEYA